MAVFWLARHLPPLSPGSAIAQAFLRATWRALGLHRPVTLPVTPVPPAIPDYELLRLVGRGSYGDVWLACGITGVYRAIKLVWRDRFSEPAPFEREFNGLREFAAVSILEPRQLALLHVGRNDAAGFFYYVMELADDVTAGREIDPVQYVPNTLKEVSSRRGRLPAAEVIALGVELSRALAGLHTRGLVHRDIKPSNIILVGGVPKLADIGLVASASAALTFVGTEGYVPPEGPGAPAADVFSLGKLLYELATGLDRNDYPRLPVDFHTLPDRKEFLELNEIIIRACERDPAKRHLDATALLDDLLLLQAGRSIRRLRSTERSLARALRGAMALTVLAAIAGIGAYVERRRAQSANALRVYSATLALAQRAIEQNNYGNARALLAGTDDLPNLSNLRGIEWGALQGQLRGDPGDVVFQGPTPIAAIASDARGQRLAFLTGAKTLGTVDTVTLQPGPSFTEVDGLIGFTADGLSIIGLSTVGLAKENRRVQFWSVEGKATESGPEIPPEVAVLGLAEKNRLLLFDPRLPQAIVVRDARTGAETARFGVLDEPDVQLWTVFRHAVSRDGRQAIVHFKQGSGSAAAWRVAAYDLAAGRIIWDGTPPGLPTAVGIMESKHRFLLCIGLERRLHFLSEETGAWIPARAFQREFTQLLEHPSTPETLLAFGDEPVVYEITASATEPLRRWRGHRGRIQSLYATPDGRFMFTGSADGTVRRWSLASSAETKSLSNSNDSGDTVSAVPSPDGRRLLLSSSNSTVAVVDTTTWRTVNSWPGIRSPLAWDQSILWSLPKDFQGVERWEIAGDAIPRRVMRLEVGPDEKLNGVELSRDRGRIATALDDGRIFIWDAASGARVCEIKANEAPLWGMTFTADGKRLWSSDNSLVLALSDTATGLTLKTFKLAGRTPGIVVSPDGKTLALAYEDGRLELRECDTYALKFSGLISSGNPNFARYTHDGKRLLLGGPAGALNVVSPIDGTVVTTLNAQVPASIVQAILAPDESWMALITNSGAVLPWTLAH